MLLQIIFERSWIKRLTFLNEAVQTTAYSNSNSNNVTDTTELLSAMKHSNVTSPKLDEDFVSDCSLSLVDDFACDDATALKQVLMFLKGAMKAKEECKKEEMSRLKEEMSRLKEEISRLREEKNESIASKFSLMEEMVTFKKEVEIQSKMILQLSKEKEQAMEQVKDVMVDMAKMLVQVQNEKEEAAKELQVRKGILEELNQKISKAVKEKEVVIESARKSKIEGATANIEELEHRVKILECKIVHLEEKCSAESEMFCHFQADTKKKIAELQIVVAELEEKVKEGIERAEMTEMLVQAAKEEGAKATIGRKAEIAEMVKTLIDTALNEQKASVLDVMAKNIEATSKLAQTELSHQEALQKISNLEKKMEGSKLFEEMTKKLLQELKAKAGIRSVKEIEKAMAEMKGAMKTQGEEMTRILEEKDAAHESKLCIMTEVKGLKEKLEMQAKMLVQVQVDNEKAQEKEQKEIQEVTEKFLQSQEEKEAKQQIAEANSKLEKNKALSLSVWKSSGTKLVSHSSNSVLNDVLNCAPLKSGTFEWKIQVHSACSYNLDLGVIGSSLKLPLDNYIGYTNKTWGYQSNVGDAFYWNDGQKYIEDLPMYTSGSVVHFVLDLTNDGTLCVSIDGSRSVQLFSNMKSLINQDEGFLPAASMDGNNKIELLEFNKSFR